MKLRNKKTGEIYEMWSESANLGEPSVLALFPRGQVQPEKKLYKYNSLAKLNEEWEDYEEQKEYWVINEFGTLVQVTHSRENIYDKSRKNFGNCFETEEEAEKAVEKLKAWKRLKDKGFRFVNWNCAMGEVYIDAPDSFFSDDGEISDESRDDLDLLFGGEE